MLLPDHPPGSSGQPAGIFATTHWSIVVRAGDSRSPEATAAMERLCQTYWYPLYLFVRRKGRDHEDACDLTQAFFAQFLEKRYLHSVDFPSRERPIITPAGRTGFSTSDSKIRRKDLCHEVRSRV